MLLALAKRNVENLSDVVPCPDKVAGCFLQYNCGAKCPRALAAHQAFAEGATNPTTVMREQGIMTTSTEGSFETTGGTVRWDLKLPCTVYCFSKRFLNL